MRNRGTFTTNSFSLALDVTSDVLVHSVGPALPLPDMATAQGARAKRKGDHVHTKKREKTGAAGDSPAKL